MGIQEVKHFQYVCDHKDCKKTVVVVGYPVGWVVVSRLVGPCGLTDYYTTEEACFCEACSQKGIPDLWKKKEM